MTRQLPKGLFLRGLKLYGKVKDRGEWKQVATGYSEAEADKAVKYIRGLQRDLDARDAAGLTGSPTVAGYFRVWLEQRKDHVADWKNDQARMRDHVLPTIGHVELVDVRARHLADLFLKLRKSSGLSPRSIRNVYSVVKAMLRDAETAGLIDRAPSPLTSRELGPLADKDPTWRGEAVFTLDEVRMLISDERIPPDRRLFYALCCLAGLRHGEAAGLRWRHIDTTKAPLGMLTVATSYDKGSTKTGAVRRVPIHPLLAEMLRDRGKPDDLVCPLEHDKPGKQARANPRAGGMRSKNDSRRRWVPDLTLLGLRHRRIHDMRATFITLLEDAGAEPSAVARLTHTGKARNAYAGYARPQWESLCRTVALLDLGAVVVQVDGDTDGVGEWRRRESKEGSGPTRDTRYLNRRREGRGGAGSSDPWIPGTAPSRGAVLTACDLSLLALMAGAG